MTIRHFTTLLVFAAAGVASAQPTRVPLRERERAVEALARALEREQTPGLTPLYFGSYVHRTPDQRGHSRDYDFGYSFVDGQGELVACERMSVPSFLLLGMNSTTSTCFHPRARASRHVIHGDP